jgi:hypothetical protein
LHEDYERTVNLVLASSKNPHCSSYFLFPNNYSLGNGKCEFEYIKYSFIAVHRYLSTLRPHDIYFPRELSGILSCHKNDTIFQRGELYQTILSHRTHPFFGFSSHHRVSDRHTLCNYDDFEAKSTKISSLCIDLRWHISNFKRQIPIKNPPCGGFLFIQRIFL